MAGMFVLGSLVSPLPSPLSELLSSATFLGFPGPPAPLTIDRPKASALAFSSHTAPAEVLSSGCFAGQLGQI